MILCWKIRFYDRTESEFKDRYLHLDTETLDLVTRAAVEFVAVCESRRHGREILGFRHLFIEDDSFFDSEDPLKTDFALVGPCEYFEDESGREILPSELAPVLTGSPHAILIPSGARQHDIDLILSERTPIPVSDAVLTCDDIRLLGYFSRDLQELLNSTFKQNGPGSLRLTGGFSGFPCTDLRFESSFTDDEARSFATIFRRLYMENEPANFLKAVEVFEKSVGSHPYGRWVVGVASEYERRLESVPALPPFLPPSSHIFTTKRLIDVYLYTQYAHQPDERRHRQFVECLNSLQGQRGLLTWLFFTEIWHCALEIGNAGRVIARWFSRYCQQHGVLPEVLASLRDDNAGLGVVEKDADRHARQFREKVEQLSFELWGQNGRPEGGPNVFLEFAREQLTRRLLESKSNSLDSR